MALDRKEFVQFVAQAMIQLQSASSQGTRLELFATLQEFFADSQSWLEDIQFQVVTNTTLYPLVPKEGGTIIGIQGTWDNLGIPVPAFMVDFGTLTMVNPPNATPPHTWFSRVVKNVLLPTDKDGVPEAPDWTLRVYGQHILDGLVGRMMNQPGKSYSDPEHAVYHLKRFRQGIKIAEADRRRANLAGAQAWAFPSGFSNGSQRGGVSTAWPTRSF